LVEKLLDKEVQKGFNTIIWSGEGHTTGIYYYKLEFGNIKIIKKMLMLK